MPEPGQPGIAKTLEKLRIYLGDITYDTVSLSTEAIPLSIGYIAAYCNKIHGSQTEITLFKYPKDLESAIINSPPDILGLSNYVWNAHISSRMFELARMHNPDALAVWGGPNFPIDPPSQDKFMAEHPEVDVYVLMEGEIGFSNIVRCALDAPRKRNIRAHVVSQPLNGCIIRRGGDILHCPDIISRRSELDDIPSPYTTGLLDKFFDGNLAPLIQTNRGCPFQCTFCVDGTDDKRIVNKFSLQRVFDEINYVAEHVAEKTNLLMLADLNFGMLPRDKRICEQIAHVQQQYGYPKKIDCSTGKNCKERVIDAVRLLNDALAIKLSVQSTDRYVLDNVKRSNIRVDQMVELSKHIKKLGLPTMTEIIVGLPGDSLKSNINTIRDMMQVDVDEYMIYTLKLIHGSELNIPSERQKWGFKTKFRILPRSFAKMSDGRKVIETEEIVVGHDGMSFEDYVELQFLSLLVFTINQPAYKPIVKFLRQNDVDVFELIQKARHSKSIPDKISEVFTKFKNAVTDELWDTPEKIIDHFQNDREYEKLRTEQAGFNIIRFHSALIVSCHMEEWTEYVISLGLELVQERCTDDKARAEQYENVANYCRGMTFNILGLHSKLGVPEFFFQYDVQQWNNDTTDMPVGNFKLDKITKITFGYTSENLKMFKHNMEIYGTSTNGMSQVLKRIPKHVLCRQPYVIASCPAI